MERWSVEHRAFTVEMYFKNNSTVVGEKLQRNSTCRKKKSSRKRAFT
jgi:hypothetical protein